MSTTVWVEAHATTVDNQTGTATGWLPGELSRLGRAQARELGARIAERSPAAIFSSDLQRAAQTVEIAVGELDPAALPPVLLDWRLRECDYGELNGAPSKLVHDHRERFLTDPYPGGESWTSAVERAAAGLSDAAARCDESTIVVVGHIATRLAARRLADGTSIEELINQPSAWQPGWRFRLPRP